VDRGRAGPPTAADDHEHGARDISATNLHERLELQGPDDELKELGDTFDDLLERLEGSFDSQRQFVANASHELRTPLSTMRASLDVAMAKPGPLPEQTVVLAGRIREELDHVDQLLESLLALARAQRGPAADEATVSLDHLVAAAIERRAGAIADRHLTVEQERCAEASVTGSATLLARLVENLVDNAVKHNGAGGWIRAATEVAGDRVRLVVENGGPALDADSVDELAQPFRRLGSERTGSDTGSGLGLSIVAAVAESQGGALELHARPAGGLRVVVDLPVAVGELVGASA
jgi:signal transduction histidine kinase